MVIAVAFYSNGTRSNPADGIYTIYSEKWIKIIVKLKITSYQCLDSINESNVGTYY